MEFSNICLPLRRQPQKRCNSLPNLVKSIKELALLDYSNENYFRSKLKSKAVFASAENTEKYSQYFHCCLENLINLDSLTYIALASRFFVFIFYHLTGTNWSG